MSERYWKRQARGPLTAAALTAATAVAITGCSGGSGNAGNATGAGSAGSAADATSSAGMAAANMPGTNMSASYSATQLRDALLTKVNGVSPVGTAQDGIYGALPDVKTSKQSMQGVTVKPAECAQATVTGFNSAAFANSPASVVTFRIGRDGVSEVIVAASPAIAKQALATKLPAACAHYRATVDGKTFAYSVKEAPVAGIAEQARALNVKAVGYADINVWSVVYRANGFVGAVTIVGPDASEQGAKVLAEDAYAKASSQLH
jgi:hypothetical protein